MNSSHGENILARSLAMYGRRFPTYLLVGAVLMVPAQVVNMYFGLGPWRGALKAVTMGKAGGMLMAFSSTPPAYTLAVSALVTLAHAMAIAALTWAAFRHLSGESFSLVTAYSAALRKTLVVTATTVLILAGAAVGFALFIVPGFIWLVIVAFAPQAVVVERRGPLEAVHRSVQMVWRGFDTLLPALAAVLVAFILAGVLASALANVYHVVWLGLNVLLVPWAVIALTLAYERVSGELPVYMRPRDV